jgi:hypothetical protein
MMRTLFCDKKFKFFLNLALSGSAILCTTSAQALPGQNIETVRQEAKNSPVLPVLVYNRQVAAYTGIRTIKDGLLALFVKVNPENRISTREQIITQVSEPGLAFTRDNVRGLEMIQRIYNPQVANDFRNSKYVAQVGKTDFYQGNMFVYITERNPLEGVRRLSLVPTSDLGAAIKREQLCQIHKCVVYHPFSPP